MSKEIESEFYNIGTSDEETVKSFVVLSDLLSSASDGEIVPMNKEITKETKVSKHGEENPGSKSDSELISEVVLPRQDDVMAPSPQEAVITAQDEKPVSEVPGTNMPVYTDFKTGWRYYGTRDPKTGWVDYHGYVNVPTERTADAKDLAKDVVHCAGQAAVKKLGEEKMSALVFEDAESLFRAISACPAGSEGVWRAAELFWEVFRNSEGTSTCELLQEIGVKQELIDAVVELASKKRDVADEKDVLEHFSGEQVVNDKLKSGENAQEELPHSDESSSKLESDDRVIYIDRCSGRTYYGTRDNRTGWVSYPEYERERASEEVQRQKLRFVCPRSGWVYHGTKQDNGWIAFPEWEKEEWSQLSYMDFYNNCEIFKPPTRSSEFFPDYNEQMEKDKEARTVVFTDRETKWEWHGVRDPVTDNKCWMSFPDYDRTILENQLKCDAKALTFIDKNSGWKWYGKRLESGWIAFPDYEKWLHVVEAVEHTVPTLSEYCAKLKSNFAGYNVTSGDSFMFPTAEQMRMLRDEMIHVPGPGPDSHAVFLGTIGKSECLIQMFIQNISPAGCNFPRDSVLKLIYGSGGGLAPEIALCDAEGSLRPNEFGQVLMSFPEKTSNGEENKVRPEMNFYCLCAGEDKQIFGNHLVAFLR